MQKKLCKRICIGLLSVCFVSLTCFADHYNSAAAHTNVKLGLAYLQKGSYPEAKSALLSALNEDPKLSSAWYSMAYFLEITDHMKSAEAYYRKAIDVKPHSGSAKNNYGTFLCRVGREKEGIKEFIIAAREPNYLNVASAYENAGTCSLMIHDKKMALYYFHKALNNNPSMPFSLLSLARLNHQMGNDASAIRYFQDFKILALSHKSAAIVQQYHDYAFSNVSNSPNNTIPPQKDRN